MTSEMKRLEFVAARFGCTIEQARGQYAATSRQLAEMAATAERKGRKVNNYTAAELRAHAARFDAFANASRD